ncbi:hypothetical protein AMATHDRAFT_64949 [Amanita thiersii Skay4041]|uniref:NAD(P)-binding domain-containing protein n=1 Tax=Amanita thiersii Skay4041 TaxID=703135 RepID=A0A2A9NLR1_9AGAR|nr:hypothetical protein AMATHDRAFT_64949 [Amanita thiersii Skay4041]
MSSALIFGATGQVGQQVLREVLASSHFTRVGDYGRRAASFEGPGKDKLEQKVVDFEKLGQKGEDGEEARKGVREGNWDVVFVALGTTKADAGSAEAFEKIDREYVLNAARAAKSDDPNHSQRIVYVSSVGANPSSPFLYPKSKGLTEQGLAELGYNDTIVFRPAMLKGTNRPERRLAETIWGGITGVLSHVSTNMEINISTLGKSLVKAGIVGTAGLPKVAGATTVGKEGAKFTLINNTGALAMAKEDV